MGGVDNGGPARGFANTYPEGMGEVRVTSGHITTPARVETFSYMWGFPYQKFKVIDMIIPVDCFLMEMFIRKPIRVPMAMFI